MADDSMYTPDEWGPAPVEGPHDHKGHSEEKCVRCGWVMGHRPLNCMNDNTPHAFPSQQVDIERLRAEVGRLRNSVDTLTNMLSEQCDMSDRYALAANKAEAENERLHVAIYWLVADIDHAHLPDPMGRLCITCGAGDGSWPCVHRRALDELKEARRG